MRNKILKTAAFALALVMALTALVACAQTEEKTVTKIEIVDGSFKESYVLDEIADLSGARIFVTYADGSTQFVPITPDMVSGLNTVNTTGTSSPFSRSSSSWREYSSRFRDP